MKKQMPKGLYAITAENFSNGRDNITVVKEMLDAGVKVLQYRDKYKTKLEKFKQCEMIRKLTLDYNVFFTINDDIDIALAVESDGLHLGQDDMPISCAKKIVSNSMIIGISTHSPAQALAAQKQGADYIGVGPIFKTFTKDNIYTPVGFEYLKYCIKTIKIHKVAIGGIKLSNIGQICKFHPDSICMVTEITASQNIKNTVKQALEVINDNN
ncbi:MAG: thiamine phosphate synthase [Endomicrobium sp.]|jgi:thiamine-phosphate pyrophosphorylase|nr:thiamine phosphate synthase [Endomicrobium sp.]